jgi:hypothetical protein
MRLLTSLPQRMALRAVWSSVFFYRRTQPPGADGFGEGVGLDAQERRNHGRGVAVIQLTLRLFNDRTRQDACPTAHPLRKESPCPLGPVPLDGAFDGDLGHAKSPR